MKEHFTGPRTTKTNIREITHSLRVKRSTTKNTDLRFSQDLSSTIEHIWVSLILLMCLKLYVLDSKTVRKSVPQEIRLELLEEGCLQQS